MLSDVEFKSLYNSKNDRLIPDFYIPALSNSVLYCRVSAYFDSNILKMYSVGLDNIVAHNGKIRFVFSVQIDEKDYAQMKEGYILREQIQNEILDAIDENDKSIELSNLAYLIAHGFVDIKIAFTKQGIFHDKFGLFYDGENTLYFRGSNNETVASVLSNYESFETSLSWNCDENELTKIENATKNFNNIWNDEEEGIIVLPLPNCVLDKILKYNRGSLKSINDNIENSVILDIDDSNNFYIKNRLDIKEFLGKQGAIYRYVLYQSRPIATEEGYVLPNAKINTIKFIINALYLYADKMHFRVYVSPFLRLYLYNFDLKVEKRKNAGIAIKHRDIMLEDKFEEFRKIMDSQMERKLLEDQAWNAFFITEMVRSANFSVPGSGKTSIVYGAFAYLQHFNKVNKIVMIGPKNSFMSWKDEFYANFGNKKKLNLLNIHEPNSGYTKSTMLKYFSGDANLILVNYESSVSLVDELIGIIDEKTLLVFDEGHRIKSESGVQADACLKICKNALYRVILTGTPIPNGYQDLYNFFHIIFDEDFDSFINMKYNELKEAKDIPSSVAKINRYIYPFFERITKKDLKVPEPEQDDLITGNIVIDEDEKTIFRIVHKYFHEEPLAFYIRMLQAGSNPQLLLKSIDKTEFFNEDDEDYYDMLLNHYLKNQKEIKMSQADFDFISSHTATRKIDKCADIITARVQNNEKVLAWGVFTSSIDLLNKKLLSRGIKSEIIYGATPFEQREEIIDRFRNGDTQVLITNPHTLGESVSLHTCCHFAIYFEYDYSLTHMSQSRDRIHRLGLKDNQKTEYCYMSLTEDPISSDFNYEEYMDEQINNRDSFDDDNCAPIDLNIYCRLKEKESLMIEAVEENDIVYVEDDYMNDVKEILGLY